MARERNSSMDPVPSAPIMHVEASPAVEFLMSLMAFGSQSPRTVEMGSGWFQRIDGWCSPELRGAIASLTQANQLWSNLVGLLWQNHLIQDPHVLIQRVHAADPLELRMLLLSHHTAAARREMSDREYTAAIEGDDRELQKMLRILG